MSTLHMGYSAAPRDAAEEHYLGDAGRAYFERHKRVAASLAKFNAFLFAGHLTGQDDLLDFGCGGGHLLNVLPAKTKTGVDINPAARLYADELGIPVFARLEELGQRSFSRIVTSHALEHVPSPYHILVELRRFLRPDGLLIWLSPMDDWQARRQRKWKPQNPDMHLYAWTPLAIGNLLQATGYEPQTVSVVTHAVPPLAVSEWLTGIHPTFFSMAARTWAMVRRMRQILAVASPR